MTNHDDVLDRIDAVIRDAEIDELVDWQLAQGERTGCTVSSAVQRSSTSAWFADQVREVCITAAWIVGCVRELVRP
ncbi:hypothetical protein SEA_PYTHEAS_77 [Gordonia phage Pytheas]|nr:hypothetical protein SEA_JABLANSKI_76 [Gordonia Phage Jablanski]UYL88104.1 hypothetical protein SEA_PYTHEAS_77 [Gordonia phage Pytheas]